VHTLERGYLNSRQHGETTTGRRGRLRDSIVEPERLVVGDGEQINFRLTCAAHYFVGIVPCCMDVKVDLDPAVAGSFLSEKRFQSL
jgi:hypothetical protein